MLRDDSIVQSNMTRIGLYLGSLLLAIGSPVLPGASEAVGPMEFTANMPAIELLQEEVLNTVSLDGPIHFMTPQATETVAGAGIYRVEAADSSRMRLVDVKTRTATVVDALNINHEADIAEPIALYVKDDEKFPHVVLLLPGGKGLEAVGSYDRSRARGLRSFQLTPIQIQNALNKKLEKTMR